MPSYRFFALQNGAITEVFATGHPVFMGGMVHGRHRKALAILSDNAYHHHDAQQRQPAAGRSLRRRFLTDFQSLKYGDYPGAGSCAPTSEVRSAVL